MSAGADREFDVILLGATGYVGRLTAMHLARHAPPGLRIAAAARSTARLSRLRDDLPAAAQGWALITVDVADADAIRALVARTRVVATTVGPYLRYGLPLVEACAESGTDYADLTGETLFVRQSIDRAHERAKETGARIVHSCGFDSIPSDLGVGLTAARAVAEGQGQLGKTLLRVLSMRGGVSGGTVDSVRQQLIEVTDNPDLRATIGDPKCLTDGKDPRALAAPAGRPRRRRLPVWRGEDGHWQTRFVVGGFNRQIVFRTNALSGWAYGPMFSYREVFDTGPGPRAMVKAGGMAAVFGGVTAGLAWAPTRRVLDKLLPDPGQGPSEQARQRGRFLLEVLADTTGGTRYRTRFGADLDFGYGGTAVMLGESALCLAQDDLPTDGGVLTPMVAMGEALAVRLRAQGFTIETHAIRRPGPGSN